MSSFLDRWDEVDRLLESALELPPSERGPFLDRNCGDDIELRRHLERLLEISPDDSILNAGAFSLVEDLGPASSFDGAEIGPYRIVKVLGAGGMGDVYLAERADGVFSQRVAIKIVRRDAASSEALGRFRHERQILASLQHPNIARLLDGGISSDGLPYLVMEYVEGLPITEYCDRHRLTIADRLRLFSAVCHAVQHAHQNLIVHRDLKPSNILVTADGTVKLLDFGIAKLLESTQAIPMPVTRTGMHLLTPEYASPEQIRGEPVTTASDVYSLGVLLYELLTGARPYGSSGGAHYEVLQLILEKEPLRPSSALSRTIEEKAAEVSGEARSTSPRNLQRSLRGDLDNIVLKALAKEPHLRYGTVDQLAEDVGRYLAGQPVRARAATFGYRFSKFVRRNRVPVTAVAAAVILIVSLVAFYTARLAVERDRSELEADKAVRMKEFLLGMFDVADPDITRGRDVTAREMLYSSADRIQSELSGQPEIQAELLATIGELIFDKMRDFSRGEALLTMAADIYRTQPPSRERDLNQARVLLELAGIRMQVGSLASADSLLQQAADLQQRHLHADDPELERTLNVKARLADDRGHLREAESIHRSLLARRLARGDSMEATQSISNLSDVLRTLGVVRESRELLESALRIRQSRLGRTHSQVAVTLTKLGRSYDAEGDHRRAAEAFREALRIRQQLFGDRHHLVARTHLELAETYRAAGAPDTAAHHLREASLLLALSAPEAAEDAIGIRIETAAQLSDRDEFESALAEINDLLREVRGSSGPGRSKEAVILERRASLQMKLGNYDAALADLQEARKIVRARFGEGADVDLFLRHEIAHLLARAGRTAGAEDALRDVLTDARARLPANSDRLAKLLLDLAEVISDHRPAEAESLAREALAIRREQYAPAHPRAGEAERLVRD